MSGSVILQADAIGRRVAGAWLWRGLTFDLTEGDRAVLVGPSGTGKSLLLRTLCGLDRPDEGRVLFRRAAVRDRDVPTFRAQVLYVQQRPVLIPGNVRENVGLPAGFRSHANGPPSLERARALFDTLGKAPGFMDQHASVLSGGEGQLVGLVRSLVLDPAVLLLDEPTAHLDLDTARRVENVILAWVARGRRSLLWTSHDPVQVERIRSGPRLQLERAS